VLWHAGSAEEEKIPLGGLVEGFRNLGYVDGENIILEHRFRMKNLNASSLLLLN
jgi:putative ABC transport system substrate-binding protein